MNVEALIRQAVDRLRAVGYSRTHYTARDAVIDQDADGNGRLDDNPDTGAGQERGSMEVVIVRDGGEYVCTLVEADFSLCVTIDDAFSRMIRAIGKAVGA